MIEGQFDVTQYFKMLSIHYKIIPVTILLFPKMLFIRVISTGKVENQSKKNEMHVTLLWESVCLRTTYNTVAMVNP